MLRKAYVTLRTGPGGHPTNQGTAVEGDTPPDGPGKKRPALVFDTHDELNAFLAKHEPPQAGTAAAPAAAPAAPDAQTNWTIMHVDGAWTVTDQSTGRAIGSGATTPAAIAAAHAAPAPAGDGA